MNSAFSNKLMLVIPLFETDFKQRQKLYIITKKQSLTFRRANDEM